MNVSKVKISSKHDATQRRSFSAPFRISARHNSLEKIVDRKDTKLPIINFPYDSNLDYPAAIFHNDKRKNNLWKDRAGNHNIAYLLQRTEKPLVEARKHENISQKVQHKYNCGEGKLNRKCCHKNNILKRRENKKQGDKSLVVHGENCIHKKTRKVSSNHGKTNEKEVETSQKLCRNSRPEYIDVAIRPPLKSPLLPTAISTVTRNLLTRYLELEKYVKEQQTEKTQWRLGK